MKIIVSHDVDHLDGWCHWWKDLYWEKFLFKALWFFLTGRIGLTMFFRRVVYAFIRKIENLNELIWFDNEHNIRATFFIGVNNALGMCYSVNSAKEAADRIVKAGFDIGVHGVAFDAKGKIVAEHAKFYALGRCEEFGIRNHYLRGRGNVTMHEWQSNAGYLFDSTDYGLFHPYKIGDMWEFPLSIMDSYVLKEYNNNIDHVKNLSIKMLEEAEQKKVPFFFMNKKRN